jgi:hypothetical protein
LIIIALLQVTNNHLWADVALQFIREDEITEDVPEMMKQLFESYLLGFEWAVRVNRLPQQCTLGESGVVTRQMCMHVKG